MSESCGNPTAEADALMPTKRKYDKSRTCVKCKVNVGNVVVRHAVYCRACFIPQMTYKFRRSLEPYVNAKPDGPRRTALKPTGNLLVAFSGGLGSTVLLDLVNRCYVSPDPALLTTDGGRDHPRHERVWKRVFVCYVECSDVLPGTKDRTDEIRHLVEQIPDVEFIPLRIQDAFDPSWWQSISRRDLNRDMVVDLNDEMLPFVMTGSSTQTPLSAMQAYLSSLPTPTALPTTLNTLIRVLLQYTALKTDSSHLLFGTSLTSLAVSLISSVSQGGGFHVKEEMQEEWFPDARLTSNSKVKSIRLIRPLKDVSVKECGVWAWWARLHIIGREQWTWPGAKPGIGRLTKDFIRGLETDYPSTVSTIVRTCGKLAPKGATSGQCLLCQRPAQEGVQEWKARIAIRARDDRPAAAAHAAPALAPLLCYVCHTTLTSRGARAAPALYASTPASPAAVPLPVWASARVAGSASGDAGVALDDGEDGDEPVVFARRRMSQEELRRAIGDFILD